MRPRAEGTPSQDSPSTSHVEMAWRMQSGIASIHARCTAGVCAVVRMLRSALMQNARSFIFAVRWHPL